jgi:RNA polymerase I-specific transcription initiation factor RRN7
VPAGILEPFPLKDLPPLAPRPSNEDEIVIRLKEVQSDLIIQEVVPVKEGEAIKRPGELYRRYRTVEELSDIAQTFYDIAGKYCTFILEKTQLIII